MTNTDIHTWAKYETTVAGSFCTVRVLDVDDRNYTVPMMVCEVLDGPHKGRDVVKSAGQLTMADESKKLLAESKKLSQVS